uniref:Tudor domain-containing protein n=1 Tax=Rhabditophanes sp. KR3021 TaxID=114890 RepID=A0AC35TQI3_9BILA
MSSNDFSSAIPTIAYYVEQFILCREERECGVNVRSVEIAQKSYSGEKRYLCPAPIIELLNEKGWTWLKKELQRVYFSDPLKLSVCATNYESDPNSMIMCISSVDNVPEQRSTKSYLTTSKQVLRLKSVYFPSRKNDNLKNLVIKHNLLTYSGFNIGTFISDKIHLVSKFSKSKNATPKNVLDELFIRGGRDITLFTKAKNQTYNKYLDYKEGSFFGNSKSWGCFEFFIIDEKEPVTNDEYTFIEDNLKYGSIVLITSKNYTLDLPLCRVMKPEGQILTIEKDYKPTENVCQMQRICLQIIGQPNKFLCLNSERLSDNEAIIKTESTIETVDSCIFYISTVSSTTSKFGFIRNIPNNPVTPCPCVSNCVLKSIDNYHHYELIGKDFSPKLTVWIGREQIESYYQTPTQMKLLFTNRQRTWLKSPENISDKSIYLLRDDGVIYPTDIEAIFH